MVARPPGFGAFEFAVLSGLRAGQLVRGCTPRMFGSNKVAVIAQLEIAERKVVREPHAGPAEPEPGAQS